MIKYFFADYILPITSSPIKEGVVAVNSDGIIEHVFRKEEVPLNVEVTRLHGVLIPGFVNAHCHLELSHLKQEIPRGGGLINFIQDVLDKRGADESVIEEAMREADAAMYSDGIQAVGDHVNSPASVKIKEESPIRYHTFVEAIGMDDEQAAQKIDEAREIEFFFDPKSTSITPHAPYSCSKSLLKLFKKVVSENNILSIHNQESEEENKLFRYKTGDFLDFYEKMGINSSGIKAQARNSLQSYLSYLPLRNRLILVHNTYTTVKDVDFLHRMNRKAFLCICPNANLYIEGRLPKLQVITGGDEVVIGTDSLASNNALSILDELKTLHRHFPELDFLETIKWATYNGAKALSMDDNLGSIEVGKKPGLVLLKNLKQWRVTDEVDVERIV